MSACDRCGGSGRIEVYMRGGKKREFSCPSCVGAHKPLPPPPATSGETP